MRRITITLEDDLAEALDAFMQARGYASRSEAVRDLARMGLERAAETDGAAGETAAALVYAYDPSMRDLAARLAERRRERHDLATVATQVTLDHAACLEVTLLDGDAAEVRAFADAVLAERGVRHGRLVLIPVETVRHAHAHGEGAAHEHAHRRLRPSF
jgi:CopG family nickel-responsive transcriptional regulator